MSFVWSFTAFDSTGQPRLRPAAFGDACSNEIARFIRSTPYAGYRFVQIARNPYKQPSRNFSKPRWKGRLKFGAATALPEFEHRHSRGVDQASWRRRRDGQENYRLPRAAWTVTSARRDHSHRRLQI